MAVWFWRFLPGSVTLTFLWPHLFQVAFDFTEVLDFGLQGFNLNGMGTNTATQSSLYSREDLEAVKQADEEENVEVPHAQCAVCGLSTLEETCRGLRHTLLCRS